MGGAAQNTLHASSFHSVPDMWHHRVTSTPDAEALIFKRADSWASLTWKQAADRVERIANGLLQAGLQAEERCVILAGTSAEWILCDLAILCAGGATTTIYPSSTGEECAYILNDCDAITVFCDTMAQVEKLQGIRSQLPTVRQVVVFDGEVSDDGWVTTLATWEASGRAWAADHPTAYKDAITDIEPSRLATLMYTSGTTGLPKGVMLTHDAWVYEGEAIDALGFMNPADRQYLFLPLAHVFAKVMQVSFIRLGIPTVVDGSMDDLLPNLQETQPTWMAAVPRVFEKAFNGIVSEAKLAGNIRFATFKWAIAVGRQVSELRQRGQEPRGALRLRWALADRLVFQKIKERFGGRMRFFISGGAPLAPELAAFFHACDILILEGYGLTESSAASCVNRLDDYRFGTVGPPMPGCEIRIAEDGEICVKSRGVMKGYYKQAEATAEVLTEDGWLKTGDIGVILDSGHVQITDRKKDIIVTAGGKNIAPTHFEQRLKTQCPYVSQVVMHGDKRAYCVALVAIDFDVVAPWARKQNLSFTDYADLAAKDEVVALIQKQVDAVNRTLPSFEQVKGIALLPEDLTQENGTLTATLKVKRRVVEARYAETLDAFYAGTLETV